MASEKKEKKKKQIKESPFRIRGASQFNNPALVEGLVQDRERTGKEIADNVLSLLKLREGDVLVDLGCGPGLIAIHMLSAIGKNGKLICVDGSMPMLERAIGILPVSNDIEFIHGDIHHVSRLIPKAFADGAILSGNMHLLTNKCLAFRQIKSILKPTGKLVIVTHVKYSWDHGLRDLYPRLVEKNLDNQPDIFADGLRLPILTEVELKQHIKAINDSGFTVKAYENDSWSGDTYTVLGTDPNQGIRRRLKDLTPNISPHKLEILANNISMEIWSGRPAQVYLLCLPAK